MAIDLARLRKSSTWTLIEKAGLIKRVQAHALYRTIKRECRVALLKALTRIHAKASMRPQPHNSTMKGIELTVQLSGTFDAPKLISCVGKLAKKIRQELRAEGISIVQTSPVAGKPALEVRSATMPTFLLVALAPRTLAMATRQTFGTTPRKSLFEGIWKKMPGAKLNPKAVIWFGAPGMSPATTRSFSALLGGVAIKAMAGTIDDRKDGYQWDVSFGLVSSQAAQRARLSLGARLKMLAAKASRKGHRKSMPASTQRAYDMLRKADIEVHGTVFTLRMPLSRSQAAAVFLPLLKRALH